MIDGLVEKRFQHGELMVIAHETNIVEALRLELDLDIVIMPVQPRTRVIVRQSADHVRRRKIKAFADRVHLRNPHQPTNEMLRKRAGARGMTADDFFTAGLLVLTG